MKNVFMTRPPPHFKSMLPYLTTKAFRHWSKRFQTFAFDEYGNWYDKNGSFKCFKRLIHLQMNRAHHFWINSYDPIHIQYSNSYFWNLVFWLLLLTKRSWLNNPRAATIWLNTDLLRFLPSWWTLPLVFSTIVKGNLQISKRYWKTKFQ